MPSTRPKETTNFLEVLFGLHFQPEQLTEDLFSNENPPYVFTLYLCLLLTILVPVVTQAIYFQEITYHWDRVLSATIFLLLSLVFFIILEMVTLWILGIGARANHIVAAISYTLPPVLNAIWLLFIWNYFTDGSITIISRYMTGYAVVDPWVSSAFPYIMIVANISGVIIFTFALRAIGKLQIITAICTAVISQIPLYSAMILGIFVAEIIVPGTAATISNMVDWPAVVDWLLEQVSLQTLMGS